MIGPQRASFFMSDLYEREAGRSRVFGETREVSLPGVRQPCITIRPTVADDLDPVWEVYKDDRAKRIGAGGIGPCSGRARFSAHRIRRSPGLGAPAFGGYCGRKRDQRRGRERSANRGRRGVRRDAAGCARVGAVRLAASPAGSGRFRRKRAPISPWVLGFWAVFDGGRSLPASPPETPALNGVSG